MPDAGEDKLREAAAEDLRAMVYQTRDRMAEALTQHPPADAAVALRTMREKLPGEPAAEIFRTSAAGRAEIATAMRRQIDGYGLGNTTVMMQVCVLFSAPPDQPGAVEVMDTPCAPDLPTIDLPITLRE